MKRIINIYIFLLLIQNTGVSQFNPSIQISSYSDNNLYRSPFPDSDLVTDIGINLNYTLPETDWNFFYSPDIVFYQNNPLRDLSIHRLGTAATIPFNDELYYLFIGGSWTSRINKPDYNYYDYNQFYFYGNFRFDFDILFLKTGYNFRYRDYKNYEELSNSRHYLFAQLNKSFETGTSIILETDYGHKAFSGYVTATTIEVGSGGGTGGGGRGRGRHENISETETTTTQTILNQIEGPRLNQIVLLARVAQSVLPKLGIYVQYRQQFSLDSEAQFENTDFYYHDEELFDDPFSYESKEISSQVTVVLPWTMKLQIGGEWIEKNYISEQAYESVEDTVGINGDRADSRYSGFVTFSKTFQIKKSMMDALRFEFNFNYIQNKSNSFWYDFKNTLVGASLYWQF